MTVDNKRNYGIDLLRIVSMLMVCLVHVIGTGGVLTWLEANECGPKYQMVLLLYTMCYGAVDCYALISGYVGSNLRLNYKKILQIWLQVLVYSVCICVLFPYWKLGEGDAIPLKAAFTPVSSYLYWYFTGYFFLMFLTPFINNMLNGMNQRSLIQLSILIFLIFSCYQTFINEFAFTHRGYSFLWLLLLYVLGGSIRRIKSVNRSSMWMLAFVYLITTWITWKNDQKLMFYISPTVLLGSMALLVFFSKIRLSRLSCSIISKLAPLTFGVYLIHTHPLIFENVIANGFQFVCHLSVKQEVAVLCISALGIFAFCSAIDAVRNILFKWLGVNYICNKVGHYLENIENVIYNKLLIESEQTQ